MPDPAVIVNVDDNEPGRYAKSRILSYAGFRVFDAQNGTEALQLATRNKPDLVLLDVNLPDMSGIDVCRCLKTSPDTSSALVLQISASATAAPHATAALNSGADAYLTEPVDPDVLVATVRALLRLRKAERDLALANQQLLALNADLHRSNQDLQQFAFVASHDLQEPLRSVVSFSSLLERSAGPRLEPREKEYLNFILQSGNRMRTLIDDLLRYSQLGQRVRTSAAVNLSEVLQRVLQDLQLPIEEAGACISADELPTVIGDEAQLGQLMQNLVGNAIKYSRPGMKPAVRITAQSREKEWIIQVHDNGIGISPEFRESVFAPFKRLHGQEIPGTGIGLAVCRRVVEAHYGQIWVESTPGHGSTFAFTLPLRAEH